MSLVPRLVTLAIVLAAGAALAVHGISAPQVPGVALAGTAPQSAAPAHASSSGSSTHAQSQGKAKPTSSKGTLLSSTQIAPFTYEVYPAAAAQATQAESGFNITVKPAAGGGATLSIQSALAGGAAVTKTFQAGDKVYWIETSYGDDAPGQDANYGDDGYVLTNAQGYITQK